MPEGRYICFYPMDRKRGELKNWYTLPIEERQRQMDLHGKIGRRYAGKVQQIISGSIGFDDWEWGVDLFADDPVIFKKLIYEMRFDEVSGVFSNFGAFYIGLRCAASEVSTLLEGKTPKALPKTRPVHTVARRVRSRLPDASSTPGRWRFGIDPASELNFRLELMAVKAIQLGQVWREEASGQSFLVTKLYNEVFSQFADAAPSRCFGSNRGDPPHQGCKNPQGLLLPGYVFTQDSNKWSFEVT